MSSPVNCPATLSVRRSLIGLLAAALGFGPAAPLAAQTFPEKPVELTVMFGGTAQTIGQLLADLMSDHLSQPVVAVSRPGGGGAVGYMHVEAAAPDGHTLIFNSNSISTAYHRGNIAFDHTAFAPIAQISTETAVVAVRADRGVETIAELIAQARASGEKLKVGNSGLGSFTHLASAAVFAAGGASDLVIHVPYGEGQAPTELLAGRIDVAVQWPGQFRSFLGGESAVTPSIVILCSTASEPTDELRDVSPCKDTGAPGIDFTMWRGLAAPLDTPPEAIAQLEAVARTAVESAPFEEMGERLGFKPAFLPAGVFAEVIERDDARIGALLVDLGLAGR